jgi:transposase
MLTYGKTFGLPTSAAPVLQILTRRCQGLSGQIAELGHELRQRSLQDEAARRLLHVPGIGPITATALSSTVVDPTSFKSVREFAGWIGLVPRPHLSGGHERLRGITKMATPTCADS